MKALKEPAMSKLQNKVAVVTGASKGIGAAIAQAFAAEGAKVVVNYASGKAGAEAVVAAIEQAGGQATAVHGDVSKAADVQGVIDAAVTRFGGVDVLVNNAGVYEMAPLEAITEASYRRMFDINVLGLLLTTQAAAKHMKAGASVINISSVVSSLRPPGSAVWPRSSDRAASASTPSTRASSRPRAPTRPASSARTSRPASWPRLPWDVSASRATSPPLRCSWRRTTPPGSPVKTS
jgi:NAD(P)-dependent dehydrogenase (short-subunit alcohol dehydrogenase family)